MNHLKVKHFETSHLMQLRNQEIGTAFDQVLEVLEGEEITVEFVATNFDDAKAEIKKLVALRNMKKKHRLTKTIRDQVQSRFDYFMVFNETVKTALKSPFEAERDAAKELDVWLEPYRKSLSRALLTVQTTLIGEMMDEVSTVEHVSEAIASLDLTNILNSIRLITQEIKTNISTRRKEMAETSRVAKELRRSAYAKIMVFLNSIEMVLNMNGEDKPVYLKYAKEINRRLDYYRSEVLSRSTRFKSAAEKEDETSNEGENAEGNVEPTSATPKVTAVMETAPYNVLTLDEGMDMDVQTTEKTNEDSTTSDALNESVTKNNDTNSVLSEIAKGVSPVDSDTSTQNGADKFDHMS